MVVRGKEGAVGCTGQWGGIQGQLRGGEGPSVLTVWMSTPGVTLRCPARCYHWEELGRAHQIPVDRT